MFLLNRARYPYSPQPHISSTMRSFLKFVVPALVLGVMSGSIIRADDQAAPLPPPPPGNQPPPPPSGPGGERRGRMDPAQQVQRLDAVLTLTDDQKAKATDIYKKMQTDMQALRSGAGTPEETMVKRQALQKSTHDQIRALLTADQQTKFDAMPPPGPGRNARQGDATPPPPPAPAPTPSP